MELINPTQESIHAHLQEHEIKTEDGTLLDFRDHMFMFDIYTDMYSLERDIAGLKAAQVTFTTTATNSVLSIAKNKHIDIIYTLPTFDDVRQFVGGKVNRIIAQNPVYQDWVSDKDTIEHKVVGDNIIYFRGTHSTKSATMVSSDLNVYDEVDSSNQEVIEQYSTRLQHSDLKRQWWFSHPSVPGNGVDKHWMRSDQKHWFIKCGACDHWQYLSWPDSFDMGKEIYQCKECSAEITDNMRRHGQWVAKKGKKNAPVSGYWIPLMLMPKVKAAEIIKYHREKPPDYFYNKVLGLPYVGGGNKVMQSQIYQNLTKDINPQDGRVVIGVDTGIKLRFVVGNRRGLFFYGEYDTWAELEKLLTRFEKSVMVIDQGGDITPPRALREKYPGRVFLAHYHPDRKTMDLVRWGKYDDVGSVHIDRNRMISLLSDEFSDRRLSLQYVESPDDWYDYWLHWSHIYRIAEEDKRTHKMVYRWERSDRDDWVHATVYWRAGMTRFGSVGSIDRADFRAPKPNSYFITPDNKTSRNPMKNVLDAVYEPPEDDDWRTAG